MFANCVKVMRLVNSARAYSKLNLKLRCVCTSVSVQNCSSTLSSSITANQTSDKPVQETTTNPISLDSICERIRMQMQLTHGSKFSNSLDNIRSMVDFMSKDVDERRLLELFVKQPELCSSTGLEWQTVLVTLSENGLTMRDIVEMLIVCPQLLRLSPDKVNQVFNCLREHGFADKYLSTVVSNVPLLLVTDPKFIAQQIQRLMLMFTHKDILKLAAKCPNVLFDDFEDTEQKVQYIVHEIGVDQKQIVSSCALAHSLFHIELRHQIMYRAGIYRKPHPKKKIENVHLKIMVDSSTSEFVENVVGITMEEFSVFERMLIREIEKRSDRSDSSDSDNDGELSESYKQ